MIESAGRVGLNPELLFRLTLRQLMHYMTGANKAEAEKLEAMRNIIFSSAKFNAIATAQSKKQADALKRHKFEWERKAKSKKPPTYGQLLPMLKAVFNNNEQTA